MIVDVGSNSEAAAALAEAPSPVVVIPVHDSYDDVVRCVESVLAHTSPLIGILIVDDGGTDRRTFDFLSGVSDLLDRQVVVLRHDQNRGLVHACNAALASTPSRDVVFLNSDVVVGPEWLDRLTDAALSSDTIATATSLTNYGTILSVPYRNQPVADLPNGLTPDEAATRVAAGSRLLRPSIPTAVGHCFYLRRATVDLVGGFDEAFDPGYSEEVDLCQRAVAHGFRHIAADDVFTFHRGGGSFGRQPEIQRLQESHEALIRKRYPWYARWVAQAEAEQSSPLADALDTARRSLVGLSVGVDGLCLGDQRMGTQRNVIATIRALAERPEIAHLVVFVPFDPPPYVVQLGRELPEARFVEVDSERSDLVMPVVDIIYRPYQVSELVELEFLRSAGTRLVVNQLDTIAFENPAYFGNPGDWTHYRNASRLALQIAHGVAFTSEASRRAAEREGLLDRATPQHVVHCGSDDEAPTEHETVRPSGVLAESDGFLLCIGASYLHKNRRFALEVWRELRQRGWTGDLVLAGPTPPHGNSLAAEAAFRMGAPELRSHVVTLGAVTDAERNWLYQHAALVLYPSTVEGFGLVPFEAARNGVPTLTSRRGSLDEVLPAGIPTLTTFDPHDAADTAWKLLTDSTAAAEMTKALLVRSLDFRWDVTAARLINLFEEVLDQPLGRIIAIEGEDDLPVGVAPRSKRRLENPTAASGALERVVGAVIGHPALKSTLSPNGSRRQVMARKVIAEARIRLQRPPG